MSVISVDRSPPSSRNATRTPPPNAFSSLRRLSIIRKLVGNHTGPRQLLFPPFNFSTASAGSYTTAALPKMNGFFSCTLLRLRMPYGERNSSGSITRDSRCCSWFWSTTARTCVTPLSLRTVSTHSSTMSRLCFMNHSRFSRKTSNGSIHFNSSRSMA